MSLSADLSCLQSGAGAEREAALASLEKQLICPICLEIFNKPVVILPCQHNLCRKCANELYQPSLFQARTTMLVSSGRFRCPSCRHEVVLDRHGVYGLQRNLLVENIIDVYKQEVCKSISISPPPPPPPLPPPEPAQATCVDHEGEKVNIYCLSCRVPTCSLCKVFGAHQSCRVAPLADVYQQQKDELKEGLNALAEHRNKIQALIDDLNQMCSDLEEAYKVQKQTVSDKFDHINSILEERRKSMTEVMSAEEEQKTGRAKALLRCYGDTVTANSKLLERAQSSMEDPDSVAFVQSSKELIEKLIAANASCPTETLDPDDENLSHYKYNFSPQYRALLSLQFPKVEEDVPEEPESGLETEETEDREDMEDTPVQYIEPLSQTVKDSPLIIPPEPVLVRDSDRGMEERPQQQRDRGDRGDSEGTELRHRGAGQNQTQREESTEERSQRTSVPERPVSPEAVKEEGMTTLQANEAGFEESEAMPLQKPEKEDEEKDDKATLDQETDTLLYPRWYKQSNWGTVTPLNEEIQKNGNDKTEDIDSQKNVSKPNGERVQTEKQVEDEAMNAPEMVSPPLDSQNATLLDQNLYEGIPQSPNLNKVLAIEPSVEGSQENTDLESLPRPMKEDSDKERCDDGSTQTNAMNVAMDEEGQNMELSEGITEVVTEEETGQNPNGDISSCGDDGEDLSDAIPEIEMGGNSEGFVEENLTEEAKSDTEDAEDAVGNQEEALESTAHSPEAERAGSVAVQAVTLLFYLLAFLVILQRFWVYIGRYILI